MSALQWCLNGFTWVMVIIGAQFNVISSALHHVYRAERAALDQDASAMLVHLEKARKLRRWTWPWARLFPWARAPLYGQVPWVRR